jgi:hypothetical protein
MATVVVLFNLKPGVDPAQYEAWARKTDLPNVNGLPSVSSFRVLRTSGLLGGKPSPYAYVELIEIDSMDVFRTDVATETMQATAREFREFADSPLFIVSKDL